MWVLGLQILLFVRGLLGSRGGTTVDATHEAWAATTNTSIEPSQWLSAHQKEAELILPPLALRQVLALLGTSDMSNHTKIIESLTSSSGAGMRIFGSLSRAAACSKVQNRVNELVWEFLGQDLKLSEVHLAEWLSKCIKELESMSGLEFLPSKRMVELPFHGILVKMAVHSLAEHLELACRAQIRAEAFHRQMVQSLPGEADIFANDGFKTCKAQLNGCLVRRLSSAREYLQEIVKAETEAVDGQKVLVPVFFFLSIFHKGVGG